MCGFCQVWLPRIRAEGIKPVSLTIGPVSNAYSIYGYKAYHMTFDNGEGFTTSQWMYPTSVKNRNHLEEAFNIKAT